MKYGTQNREVRIGRVQKEQQLNKGGERKSVCEHEQVTEHLAQTWQVKEKRMVRNQKSGQQRNSVAL